MCLPLPWCHLGPPQYTTGLTEESSQTKHLSTRAKIIYMFKYFFGGRKKTKIKKKES